MCNAYIDQPMHPYDSSHSVHAFRMPNAEMGALASAMSIENEVAERRRRFSQLTAVVIVKHVIVKA